MLDSIQFKTNHIAIGSRFRSYLSSNKRSVDIGLWGNIIGHFLKEHDKIYLTAGKWRRIDELKAIIAVASEGKACSWYDKTRSP